MAEGSRGLPDQGERKCAVCGGATLDRISGRDDWDMISLGREDLSYRCSGCGAREAIWTKGTVAGGILVGLALLAFNLSDQGAISFLTYIAASPGDVARDVLADGIGGILGFLVLTVLLGVMFVLLPAILLGYAGRSVLWRIRNPLTGAGGQSEPGGEAGQTDAGESGPGWLAWLETWTIVRSALIGAVASVLFTAVVHLSEDFGATGLVASLLTAGLWWLLMRRGAGGPAPLWLIVVFFFLFLLPLSMLIDVVLSGGGA